MTHSNLTIPMYADKPQRRIPGTTATAVTLYKSHDGTVRQYAIMTPDAMLGTAHYQPAKSYRPAGYTLQSVPAIGDEQWRTLTTFALEMGKRLGVDVAL